MNVGLMWGNICESTTDIRKNLLKNSAAILVVALVLTLGGCGGGVQKKLL